MACGNVLVSLTVYKNIFLFCHPESVLNYFNVRNKYYTKYGFYSLSSCTVCSRKYDVVNMTSVFVIVFWSLYRGSFSVDFLISLFAVLFAWRCWMFGLISNVEVMVVNIMFANIMTVTRFAWFTLLTLHFRTVSQFLMLNGHSFKKSHEASAVYIAK